MSYKLFKNLISLLAVVALFMITYRVWFPPSPAYNPDDMQAADVRDVRLGQITGEDETYIADVFLQNAVKRLQTSAIVTIEQLFGRDPQATSYFYIGTEADADGVGSAGDTIRIQIPANVTPIGTIYPAVDVTTTVTAAMVAAANPERELAEQIINDLNSDDDFKISWRAEVIKDHSGIFIASRIFNQWAERTSWTVTPTGTTTVNIAYDDIVRRGYATELARSPNDPRLGILAISGSVISLPGAVSNLFNSSFLDNSNNSDMTVLASPASPVYYWINCDDDFDTYIQQLRIFVTDNGMKLGQWAALNVPLANGIIVEIRSDGDITTLTQDPLTTNDDLIHHMASPLSNYLLSLQPGRDDITSAKDYPNPFIIRKCGTNTLDDYIKVTIQDDLSAIINQEMIAFGFKKEP